MIKLAKDILANDTILLRDGKTKMVVKTITVDEINGNVRVVWDYNGDKYMVYLPDEQIEVFP